VEGGAAVTVLVTGATGLLGSHVTDLLVARGERPRVLVRHDDQMNGLTGVTVDICWGDMKDRAALKEAVSGVDCILHCAARTGPWGPEAEYESTNVRGLKMLVELAMAAGVRRFVHVSSITVHGNSVSGTVDETAPLRMEPNPYSRSKVAGERMLDMLIRERGAPVTIVRPGWIYGPRDAASFGRFATMIQDGRMIIVGSGKNHVPLIYVGDAAQGVLLASETDQAVGKSYLLVNDEPVTQHDYLGAIAAQLGVPPPKRHIPYQLAMLLGTAAEMAGHLAHRQQSPPLTRFGIQLLGGDSRFIIRRARQDLGFSPNVTLAEGVRHSTEWYRSTYAAAPALMVTK
jgi:nucleoside-diphosphate-sugar epimerase